MEALYFDPKSAKIFLVDQVIWGTEGILTKRKRMYGCNYIYIYKDMCVIIAF